MTEFTCTDIVYEYLYPNELIKWRSGQLIALYTVILPSLSVVPGSMHLRACVCVYMYVYLCAY